MEREGKEKKNWEGPLGARKEYEDQIAWEKCVRVWISLQQKFIIMVTSSNDVTETKKGTLE